MHRLFSTTCLTAFIAAGLSGCDTDQPTNTMEGVSEEQVMDYDAMVEADNARMQEAETGAVEEGE